MHRPLSSATSQAIAAANNEAATLHHQALPQVQQRPKVAMAEIAITKPPRLSSSLRTPPRALSRKAQQAPSSCSAAPRRQIHSIMLHTIAIAVATTATAQTLGVDIEQPVRVYHSVSQLNIHFSDFVYSHPNSERGFGVLGFWGFEWV